MDSAAVDDTTNATSLRTPGDRPRSGLATATLVIAVVFLGGVILVEARSLLVPLAIAVLIWSVINAFAGLLSRTIRLGDGRLPGWASLGLSLIVCLSCLAGAAELIAANVQAMAEAAPRYQANLEQLATRGASSLGLSIGPDIVGLSDGMGAGDFLLAITNGVAGLVGDAGTILIYVAFLLVEQQVLRQKLAALMPNTKRRDTAMELIDRIRSKVQTYLATKTATSLLMGVTVYAITAAVGLDFAPFWGFLAFIANFIPVIGGIVSGVLPALLALIAFPTLTPFLVVAAGIGAAQLVIGNVLEPRVVGRSVNLSPLTVILALSAWGFVWGVPGMFLCIPLTVIAMIVCAQFPSSRGIAIMLSEAGQIDPEATSKTGDA